MSDETTAGSTTNEATATVHATMPLMATLGAWASEFSPEVVQLHLEWAPGLCTSNGLLHGGAIMALADAAGGASGFLNLPEGAAATSTIESKTNFLRGVKEGTVTATSRPLHAGSTTIVIETEVTNGDRLVAKVTQTQAVLRPRT
ncbi:MAG: PaaI family thioesterase [Acidimicrobiales bacterium]